AGTAAMMIEDIGRAGHPAGEVANQPLLAAPEAALVLAIGIIPFRPSIRKSADLVSAQPQIPGFCDQLYLRQRRVLPHGGEERRLPVEAIGLAPQSRGQIEAETIDVIVLDPVAQG